MAVDPLIALFVDALLESLRVFKWSVDFNLCAAGTVEVSQNCNRAPDNRFTVNISSFFFQNVFY